MPKDSFDYIEVQPASQPKNVQAILWNVFAVLAILAALCIGSFALLVFINPVSAFNPFPPPTMPVLIYLDTPTPTPKNILPPTWTPTSAPPPTVTNIPEATFTPFPTQTPGSSSEGSGDSGVVNGHPFQIADGSPQYIPNLYHPDQGCNWLGVAGQVFDMSGAPVKQMLIELGGILDGKPMSFITVTGLATNYGDAGYEFVLADKPVESKGKLWLQLVDQQNLPLTEKVYFDTFNDCDKNLILINFRQVK
ncbi:MAG TPA: hypothetical protein G4N95_06000, partial [Anaerolineae bacterium]|nr:hypothetical protein [Anaerolineae bacterium]